MFPEMARLLDTLGLNEKEAKILGILFQYDGLRVADLAKKAGLNRTTSYGILKSLIVKGLVSSTTKDGIQQYQSIDPGLLPNYIDRQKDLLEERKKEIARIIPQVQKLREERGVFPRMLFFEGLEGLKQAYEDTLENNNGKLIEEFTGPDAMFDELGQEEWVRNYIEKRKARGIKCRIIAPDTKWSRWTRENDVTALRITKLIPEKYRFASEVVLYDNKVGIFSFSKEKPVAVIIEDDNICQTLRTLFRYIDDHIQEG